MRTWHAACTSPKRTSLRLSVSPVEHENAIFTPVLEAEACCAARVTRQTPSGPATPLLPPKLVVLTVVPGAAKPKTIALAGARWSTCTPQQHAPRARGQTGLVGGNGEHRFGEERRSMWPTQAEPEPEHWQCGSAVRAVTNGTVFPLPHSMLIPISSKHTFSHRSTVL